MVLVLGCIIHSASINLKQASPNVSIENTANWKSYTDSTYGFTLKYPTYWVYKELTSNLYNKKTVGFKDKLIGYESYPGDFTFSYIITQRTPDSEIAQFKKDVPGTIQSSTIVDGITSVELKYGNSGTKGVKVILNRNSTTYEFTGVDGEVFTTILTSLKFNP